MGLYKNLMIGIKLINDSESIIILIVLIKKGRYREVK